MKNRNFVNVNVNPCKMCMPIGAVIAFKGIARSMMILHGSQGCSAYMRTHMTTHFCEPVDIASSSLSEHGTVHGGEHNLKKGLKNMMQLYNSDIIGVSTTCLAETIGEDIRRITAEFIAQEEMKNTRIITTNTPGYGGTLYEGYFTALTDVVKQIATNRKSNRKVNVIMAHLSPGDVRNIKSIMDSFGLDYILLPDISNTLDAPFTQDFKRSQSGGTRLEDIKRMAGARATIELGVTVPAKMSPGQYLLKEFGVPLYRSPIPIGIANTDLFMEILADVAQKPVPSQLLEERGRLLDGMIDAHKLNGEGKALIYGDPDQVYSVSQLCFENGIKPMVIATGSQTSMLKGLLQDHVDMADEKPLILDDTDFETIEKYTVDRNVNVIIGNSSGKQITEKHGIPPVRIGFPIQDRVGGQRLVYTGYSGSLKLLDDIGNAILSKKFGMHRKVMYEKYFHKSVG